MHWLATFSFALGVWLSSFGFVPWPLLFWGFFPGFFLLVLQFRRKINPWIPFVWNIMLSGAIWMGVRLQYDGPLPEGRKPVVERREPNRFVLAASERMAASGLSESDLALIDAMLLGNRQHLDNETKSRFRNAGAQHLLALSGLHLGIFVGLLSYLFIRRFRFSRWRWAGLAVVLLPLWVYCLLVGMPQSLLRAIIMTTLFLLGQFSYRTARPGTTLAVAMLLMLLIAPRCLFDVGTQLSCVAVGALVWLYPPIVQMIPVAAFPRTRTGGWLRRAWQLFAVSLSAWLGTMPLSLFYFQTLQPWQALSSFVLVPLATVLLYFALLLLLLSVCGLWFLAVPLAKFMACWIHVENVAMDFLGSLPFGTMRVSAFHPVHVLLLYLILSMFGVGIQGTAKVKCYTILFILLSFVVLIAVSL